MLVFYDSVGLAPSCLYFTTRSGLHHRACILRLGRACTIVLVFYDSVGLAPSCLYFMTRSGLHHRACTCLVVKVKATLGMYYCCQTVCLYNLMYGFLARQGMLFPPHITGLLRYRSTRHAVPSTQHGTITLPQHTACCSLLCHPNAITQPILRIFILR